MADRGMRAAQALKTGMGSKVVTTASKAAAPKTGAVKSSAGVGAKPGPSTAKVTTKPGATAAKPNAGAAAPASSASLASGPAALIRDIEANQLQAVQDRLKKEKPNQLYTDPDSKLRYMPLHAAVRAGSVPILNALLDAGADAAAVDSEGATPLHWLAASGHQDGGAMADSLVRACPAGVTAINAAQLSPLHLAAQHGPAQLLAALCKAPGVEMDASLPGFTPLHAAARSRRLDCINVLLAAGACLTTTDAQGCTTLLTLIQGGAVRGATALLAHDVDCNVNAVTADGRTALMLACSQAEPDLELVSALLAKGASPDAQDPTSQLSVTMAAIAAKQVPVARALLQASQPQAVRYTSPLGVSALTLARDSGEEALLVAVLVALGPDAAGPEALALMKAALAGKRDDTVAALVGVLKPAQLTALELDAKSLLAQGLPAGAVAYLQKVYPGKGVDCPVDDDGGSLMHLAAAGEGTSYEVCAALLRLGLSVHSTTKAEGATPLHVAAKSGNVAACRALMDGGADPTKRNVKNRTPGNQPKIPECTRDYLAGVEEEYKKRKDERKADMFGSKIQATQTESAFGLRCV